MARTQDRKRDRADALSRQHRPNKKTKPGGRLRGPPNFPPEFWDNLSKVPLTRRALRELDRRNKARSALESSTPVVYTTHLSRFARHGGPDLDHLHEYPKPKRAVHTMSSRRRAPLRKQTKPTESAESAEPKISTPYDKASEQHLHDNNVYLRGRNSKPKNKADMRQPRPALLPSKFSDGAFECFQDEHEHLGSEADVMRKIIPVITGNANTTNSGETVLSNLQSVSGEKTVNAKPDFYDGARFGDVDKKVRTELSRQIVPTTDMRRPVAPNFFLEAKSHAGGADVAKRQAGHDGALGGGAMHALQNYGEEQPAYDGNAYTYSSTYRPGMLELCAHHVTPPATPGGRPGFHMAQLRAFAMADTRETFVEGAMVFRNARDLAKEHRDGFIRAANTRARQTDAEPPPKAEDTAAVIRQYGDLAADESVDLEENAE